MQDTIARDTGTEKRSSVELSPGSAGRNALKAELAKMGGANVDVPLYIGGEQVRTSKTRNIVTPHSHQHSLRVFLGGSKHVEQAIAQALAAQTDWAAHFRGSSARRCFLKATGSAVPTVADAAERPATMLGTK